MKNLYIIFIFLIISNCSSNKGVYWCGDHACVNKKEKEAYFKKNMIVEIKNLDGDNYKKNSEYEKIIKQAKLNEENRIKN